MKKIIFLSIILGFFAACSSIQPMRVQVMRPAQITVAPNIQTVTVLNRSIPTRKSNWKMSFQLKNQNKILLYRMNVYVD
ncbi:MAG: hypothetical protein ACK46Y_11100 [Fluviicola sp.]